MCYYILFSCLLLIVVVLTLAFHYKIRSLLITLTSITYYKMWIYLRKRIYRLLGVNPHRRNKAIVNESSLGAPLNCCSHPPRKTSLCFLSILKVRWMSPRISVLSLDLIPEKLSPLTLLPSGAPPPPPKTWSCLIN